jgi:hypothetical protein
MWYFDRNAVIIGAFALAAAIGYTPDAQAAKGNSSSKPMLSFTSDVASVKEGGTVLLSWASANVSKCTASGAWSGSQAATGSYRTQALKIDSTFTLTCQASRGKIQRSVLIDVVPAPTTTESTTSTGTTTESSTTSTSGTTSGSTSTTSGTTTETSTGTSSGSTTTSTTTSGTTTTSPTTTVTPRLALQASASAVKTGESVTLTWTGEAVSNCQASGSWTGSRATNGSEVRSQLTTSQSYTLTCDSATGQVVAMTSVQVWSGGTEITWSPPTQNDDGTPLTDLAAYRIYVGTISRNYYQQVDVSSAAVTKYFLDLLPGEYYISMSAIDAEGNESALSNEVRKLVQ